jgi:O-antigen/teichoic acid export membrane protein
MNVIKRNVTWLLLSQALTAGLSVAVLLLVPRHYGDEAFGRLAFAGVYVSFFELVAMLGTGAYVAKEVARDTSTVARYVVNTLVMKVLVSAALIAAALGVAALAGFPQETVLLIAVACVSMLFNVLNSAIVGGLNGLQRMRGPALWDVARAYVGGGLGLVVLFNGGSLLAFATVYALAAAIPLIANGVSLLPQFRSHETIDLGLWRSIVIGGVPFFIWSALLVVYGTIDIPLLEAFSGSETVGWYTLAYRWVGLPAFFAASVGTAFFPALSADSVRLPYEFVRKANRALHFVALIATPAALGIALTASGFIDLLYGPEFRQVVPLMWILAAHIPIVGIDIVLGSVVVAADRQKQWVIVGVVAAIFNPLVNLAVIPLSEQWFGNGAIGAAVVTVVTELILLAGALRLRPAGVLDGATARLLGRIVVASLTMVPVLLVLRPAPLGVQIVAGIAVYGLASLAFGTVSLHDVRAWTSRRPSASADVPA